MHGKEGKNDQIETISHVKRTWAMYEKAREKRQTDREEQKERKKKQRLTLVDLIT